MRPLAIVPFLCAAAAFVLAMLCIFAGDKVNFMENMDMLTLNTSMLGEFTLNSSSSSGGSGIASFLSNIGNTIEGDIEGDVNGLINDVAKAINIHDFYSAHMLDYCEGFYTPSPISNATSHPTKNVTRCSNRTALFFFDPTTILQSELNSSITLDDIHWPTQIDDAIKAIEIASKVMFVLYCVGIGFTGLALIGALFGVLGGGRLSALVNFMVDFLAFLTLGIASAISTAMIVKIVDAVNKYGNPIGVAAYKGSKFLTFTWVATGVMFVAMLVWVVEFCIGRRNQVRRYRDGKESRI